MHAGNTSDGRQAARARTVIVYGNCQAPFVAQMLSALDDLNDHYRFVAAASYLLPGETEARPVPDADLQDAVLLLCQWENTDRNPAMMALKSRLPAGCPVVTFPSLMMLCLWPFECPEPRVETDPRFLWKRYPLGDMIGLEIAKTGLSGPMAVAAYLDLSMRKMPDLQVRLQRDLKRMRDHDARSDVKMADYVESRFRRDHMFWTSGHVSAAAIAELTRRIASCVRSLLGGASTRAEHCIAGAQGFGGLGDHQVPIHPAVADALGLEFWSSDQTYRWYTQHWTFYEYIERYIAYDSNW